MRPVGLISNPGSGHNRDRFAGIREQLDAAPGVHHQVTNDKTDIAAALDKLVAQRVEVLAINGGDGTAAAILGQLLEHPGFEQIPQIVLLPGGTANMTAGDVGVPGKLQTAVTRFCRWCEEGATAVSAEARPMLRVRSPDGSHHYGMFLGGGAVMQGTEYAHREIHSRGLRDDFSLALGTARTLWGVFRDDPSFNQHVEMALSLDGAESIKHDTLILAISTLQRLAFGMRPFWGAGEGAIRLTLMEQHCTAFLRTFVSIARGRPNGNAVPGSGYFSHNADHINLTLCGSLNLDGEIIEVDGSVGITPTRPLEFLRL